MSTPAVDCQSDRIPLTRPRTGAVPTLRARVKRQATSSYLGSAGCENTPTRLEQADVFVEDGGDERILLNVGGVRHETHVSTLRTVPNSRLSRLAETHLENGGGRQEYFFDRHPSVFNSIIDFYRTRELHVPLEVCGAVVKRELDFWQINELEIKACCWRHYRSYIENQHILDSFNHSLLSQAVDVDLNILTGWKKLQWRVWLVLEYPRTSRLAMIYGVTSFLFVVTSIAGFCLETLPELRPKFLNVTTECEGGHSRELGRVMTSHEALNTLDIICTVFFTLELILRFIFAPDKRKFIFSLMNVIDLLALVPLYVQVIFTKSDNMQACYLNERFVIEIMFILRIIRMFRIFHLVKHYQALKVLVYAIKASIQELLMLFIFLLIGMLIFSTMIYYAERKNTTEGGDMFSTIPMGFWWSIITMTTVGYGDVYPTTPVGYIVGTACSVSGVLLVALTIPVISNNFTLFYRHVQSRAAIPRSRGGDSSECDSNFNSEFERSVTRKTSNDSNVLTFVNGHVTGIHFSGSKSRSQQSGGRWSQTGESASSVSVKKSASDYMFQRNRSFRAYSDDGVMYKGETVV
ncbi:noninactivating potassium channel [Aplysia californica]|uniref:Noninactivating potassium channel n=1 Tax=Aplysia californica TaxID=6500 RepID=Q16976_APLCA|nr:noninactivating potassium channel [Aplysia californica]AAA62590.1 noninactivating potassium channel [Aplysia californica]